MDYTFAGLCKNTNYDIKKLKSHDVVSNSISWRDLNTLICEIDVSTVENAKFFIDWMTNVKGNFNSETKRAALNKLKSDNKTITKDVKLWLLLQ